MHEAGEAEVEVAFRLGVPLAVAGEVVVALHEGSEAFADVEAEAEGQEGAGNMRHARPSRAHIVADVEPVGDVVLEEQVERRGRVGLHKAIGHAGERDGEVGHQGDLGHPFVALEDFDLGADDEWLHVVGPVAVVKPAKSAVVLQSQFSELGDAEAQHRGGQQESWGAIPSALKAGLPHHFQEGCDVSAGSHPGPVGGEGGGVGLGIGGNKARQEEEKGE